METLYKYYSSAFDLDKHILEPTIRLSQTSGLNDPFEGKISGKMMDILCKRISLDKEMPLRETEEETLADLKGAIENLLNSIAVVSLTETQRNLLMWSHYASEHRGCCIGYEANIFKDLELGENDVSYSYTPTKVSYDSIVFDYDQITALDHATPLSSDELNTVIKRAITTKGDAWIYEKEHRLVVPIEWCDKIILRSTESLPKYASEPFQKMVSSGNYNIEFTEQDATITPIPGKERLWPESNVIRSYENLLSRYKDTMFLKAIDRNKIKSIYLGLHYPQTKQRSLINTLKNNGLSHINLYKSELSSKRFEIIQEKVKF